MEYEDFKEITDNIKALNNSQRLILIRILTLDIEQNFTLNKIGKTLKKFKNNFVANKETGDKNDNRTTI